MNPLAKLMPMIALAATAQASAAPAAPPENRGFGARPVPFGGTSKGWYGGMAGVNQRQRRKRAAQVRGR